MERKAPVAPRLRSAEVMGVLSLATDLAVGAPLEHGLRSCLLAVHLAEQLGLDPSARRTVYYVSLLRFIGCTSDAVLWMDALGDEIAIGGHFHGMDRTSQQEGLRLLFRHVGRGEPPLRRARMIAHALAVMGKVSAASPAAHCEVGERLAERLSLDTDIADALGKIYERWDGRGLPRKLRGEDVPVSVRVTLLVRDAELFYRLGGVGAAVEMVKQRSGSAYDPWIVACFCTNAEHLFAAADMENIWENVLEAEPDPNCYLSEAQVDAACRAIADFVDLRSPYMGNHSSSVAMLAEDAARRCRLPEDQVVAIRRAALMHDLGRVCVTLSIWHRPGKLSSGEWEQVRLHAYHTERLVSRSSALKPLGVLAAHHHERLDGSGYHRGAMAEMQTRSARILAAADTFQAMREPRPHRRALSESEAEAELRRDVSAGRLDAEMAGAVLAAAGRTVATMRRAWPGGLTRREVEVVRLIARGASTREIAHALTISIKTADHHIQHIYDKLAVSTRPAVTLFALQHDLLAGIFAEK